MIQEPRWLDYSGQTIEEIVSAADQYRTDSLVVAVEAAILQKVERLGEESVSEAESLVLAIEAMEREVNNGGYHQFFFNSSRVFTPVVARALAVKSQEVVHSN